MKSLRAARLVALLVAVLFPALAAAAAGLDLAAVPPPDPSILQGTLPNGMRYYVRHNPKPEKRVELRLAVKVGSVEETEAERGLAHLNEHMNFNGTANFKSGEIVSYLESIGARFGADSNAYTNYDETVYMLDVPTDKPGAVDKALAILSDWAGRATLASEEIEKERGVVLDELRGGKGARKRIRDKQNEVLFKGSVYADRAPIGLEKVIKGASADVVRGFYHRWYRPDIMAVVVVGDVDAKAMEQQVRATFGALPAPAEHTVVPTFPVPPHDATLYSVESDKELTSSSVAIYHKHEHEPTHTVGDVRRGVVEQVASGLLSLRLYERTLKADPPFLQAGAGSGHFIRTLDVFTLSARAKDGEVPKAASALMEELQRAREHGFLPDELERVKTFALNAAESQYKESPQRRHGERIGGIVASFLENTPLSSDEYDYQLTKDLLPGITIDEVNAALRRLSEPTSRVVLVQVPDKAGVKVLTADELREAVEPKGGRQVAAYVDDLGGKTLMGAPPEGGRIVSRHAIPEVGVEEIVLSNGVRVAIKSTDFRNDEVSMSGFAQGGASDLPPDDFMAGIRADTLASQSGIADFTQPQLEKLFAGSGKLASASPGVARFTREMNGSARPQDLETMLQLVYLYFVKPAFRDEPFKRMIDAEVESLQNALNSPQGRYSRAVSEVSYDGNRLWAEPTVEQVRALEKDDLERLYRSMFDDGSEWTFIFVGNVDVDEQAPLIARYLGALPSSSSRPRVAPREEAYQSLDIHFPSGKTERMVIKGIEDQSRSIFMIDAPYRLDPQAWFDLDALTDLLEIRLRDRLREARGDTYGVGVGLSNLSPYRGYGRINVSFTSSPDARDSMMKDVRATIETAKRTLATEEEIDKLRAMRIKSLQEARKENGYWMGRLFWHYLEGRDLRTVFDYDQRIARLDAKQLRSAARRWLDLDRTAEVWLVPETWGPAPWMKAASSGATASPAPALVSAGK